MIYLCKKSVGNCKNENYYEGELVRDVTDLTDAIMINHIYFEISNESALNPKLNEYFFSIL